MFLNLQNVLDKQIYHVYTVKLVLRGHLWVKEKWPEVTFGSKKNDLIRQVIS